MMFDSKVKKEKELIIYKGNIKITRRKLITKKKRVDNCIKNYQVKRINSRRRYKGSIQEEDITITNIYAPNIEHFLPYKNFLTKMQKAFEIC